MDLGKLLGGIAGWAKDTAGAIGNTVKDTYTAIAGGLMTPASNMMNGYINNKEKDLRDQVAKRYGYNSYSEIDDAGWNNKELTNALNRY